MTSRPAAPPAAAENGPRQSATVRAGVQASPEYRLAAADFARGDAAGALRRVEGMLGRANLAPSDREFLQRQKAICVARLSGKPVTAPRPTVAEVRQQVALTPAQADCGPRALLIACRQFGVPASLDALRRAAGTTGKGTSLAGLISAAKTVGLRAEGVQVDGPALANLDRRTEPELAWVDGTHYVTVLGVDATAHSALIRDPNHATVEEIALTSGPTSLLARSGGILLLLSRGAQGKAGEPASGT